MIAAAEPLKKLREDRQRTPQRWGRRLVHLTQRDQSDCGATCLAMIAAHYGCPVSSGRLRDMANVDVQGASLWSLARAAEALGFHARGLRLPSESLGELTLPAIVHWRGDHFVVLYRVCRQYVLIADPATGLRRIPRSEFASQWTERVLELVPGQKLTQLGATAGAWRRYVPLLIAHRHGLLQIVLASTLLSLFGLGMPFFTQAIVDRVLADRSVTLLNMLLVGMLMLAVLQATLRAARTMILTHVSTQFDARLIADFVRKLMQLPLRFFDLRRAGDVVALVGENRKVRSAIANTLPAVILDTFFALGYFAVLAWYDVRLTATVVVTLFLFAVLLKFFSPRIRTWQREQFLRSTAANTFLLEAVHGIRSVKSMSYERQARRQFESLYIDYLLAARQGISWSTVHGNLAGLVQTVSCIFFLWYGADRVLQGAMTVGELLAFVSLAGNVVAPVLNVIQSWESLQEARNALDRLNEVFAAEPEQDASRALVAPPENISAIEFDDVHFDYGQGESQAVLSNVQLKIRAGEFVGIVGRSGSGKSTLLKLLLGLYPLSRGRILIDGQDLRTICHETWRRRVGVVPQEVHLFSGTIRENIAWGDNDAPFSDVVQAALSAGAHEFIGRLPLGYDTRVGEQGMALSGGQRQRIALARALLRNPEVLLLDEATAALDNASEREVQENLRGAVQGRTTIVVAHRLSTVRHADRILVVENGQIVEQGTHEALLARRGAYFELACLNEEDVAEPTVQTR